MAVFEIIEVKGGRFVKERDFEAEKIKIDFKKSNIQLIQWLMDIIELYLNIKISRQRKLFGSSSLG